MLKVHEHRTFLLVHNPHYVSYSSCPWHLLYLRKVECAITSGKLTETRVTPSPGNSTLKSMYVIGKSHRPCGYTSNII